MKMFKLQLSLLWYHHYLITTIGVFTLISIPLCYKFYEIEFLLGVGVNIFALAVSLPFALKDMHEVKDRMALYLFNDYVKTIDGRFTIFHKSVLGTHRDSDIKIEPTLDHGKVKHRSTLLKCGLVIISNRFMYPDEINQFIMENKWLSFINKEVTQRSGIYKYI